MCPNEVRSVRLVLEIDRVRGSRSPRLSRGGEEGTAKTPHEGETIYLRQMTPTHNPTTRSVPPAHTKPKTRILPLTDEAEGYLTGVRGLAVETLQDFRIGCNDRGTIVIPFYDETGDLQLVKFRHPTGAMLTWGNGTKSAKTYIEPGGKGVLLGSHLCHPSAGPLVICFGDYDAMSVHQDGVPNAVSLPFGDKGFDFINHQWEFLEQFREIVIFNDLDTFPTPEAKAKAEEKLEELVKRLGKYRCRIVQDTDRQGAKDANELLLKAGPGSCRTAVENAIEFPEAGFVRVADYIDEDLAQGRPTGFRDVDQNTGGFCKGDLVVLGGDNGAGKTTLVLTLIANSIDLRVPVFFWSGEQRVGKIRYWFHRIVAGPRYLKKVVKPATGFAYYFPHDDYLPFIKEWYRDYFFQLADFFIEPKKFFEVAELAIRRHDCGLIVIDNLMAFTGGEGEGYYQAQADFTQSCKMFAEKWGVTVVLIAHNRKGHAKTQMQIEVPTKDDIEGAKKITNWADLVLQAYKVPPALKKGLYQDTDGILGISKCRESGIVGDIALSHEPDSNRLIQLSEKDQDYRQYGWEELYRKAHATI